MKPIQPLILVFSLLLAPPSDAPAQANETPSAPALTQPVLLPPPLSRRAEGDDAVPGERLILDDGEKEFTLFLPKDWKPSADVTLAVHFRGLVRVVIAEHVRRGAKEPLIAADWGAGTPAYRTPFLDRHRFPAWLKLVTEKLKEKGAPAETRITALHISAFSDGYGAIREIVKEPQMQAMIRRVVLCDSMYASYESAGSRKLLPEHVDPWLPLMRAAMKGEKTFVFTFSGVATQGYASSSECAAALCEILQVPLKQVDVDSCPAANDDDFPLLQRADTGNLHIWGYGGNDSEATLTHLRHLADLCAVLDAAGKP